jgi:hypothetical protein
LYGCERKRVAARGIGKAMKTKGEHVVGFAQRHATELELESRLRAQTAAGNSESNRPDERRGRVEGAVISDHGSFYYAGRRRETGRKDKNESAVLKRMEGIYLGIYFHWPAHGRGLPTRRRKSNA